MWRVRSKNVTLPLRSVVRNQVRRQETQVPPAPQPPKKSGVGLFAKFTVGTLGLAGGATAYAWYDPAFRKIVEDAIPGTDMVFSAIFPEDSKKPVDDIPQVPQRKVVPKPVVPPPEKPASMKKTEEEPAAKKTQKVAETKKEAPAKVAATTAASKTSSEKDKQQAQMDRKLQEKEVEEAAENAALDEILSSLSAEAAEALQPAIDSLGKAAHFTREHAKKLRTAMEDKDILMKEEQWREVKEAFSSRKEATAAAESVIEHARANIHKLTLAVEDGRKSAVTTTNKVVTETQKKLNEWEYELDTAVAKLRAAEAEGRVMSELKELVEEGRAKFMEELRNITPDVGHSAARDGKLSEDDLNALIAHAHLRVDQLQRQLAEQDLVVKARVKQAIEQQRSEDESVLQGRVKQELEHEKRQLLVQKGEWLEEQEVEKEKELRKQLARQAAAHADHLAEVLRVQKEKLEQRFDGAMHERLIGERSRHSIEMGAWLARVRGIEAAIEGRAAVEEEARRAQELWLACLTLNKTIAQGVDDDDKLTSLATEVVAVKEAGRGQAFIGTLADSIPQEALAKGVYSETDLHDRFYKVHRVCKRVSMMGEQSDSLPRYLLSYLQSFLVFETVTAKSDEDLIEPESMGTFSLLAHAKYCMKNGNIEQAVRYMNQLEGQSRFVSSDWLKDARLFLETRQTADAMTAYASASGLGSLFGMGLGEKGVQS